MDKKCFFLRLKTVFLGQEVHYFMVYIAYYAELNLQICNYAFVAKIVNTRLTKIMAIFALAERLPTSATLRNSSSLPRFGIGVSRFGIWDLKGMAEGRHRNQET